MRKTHGSLYHSAFTRAGRLFVMLAFLLTALNFNMLPVNAATSFYVSTAGNDLAGDGSSGNPWRTIQHAADTMAAGDTVIVNEGTYNETIQTVRSGISGRRITFRASGDVSVTGFTVSHSYITVDGFNVSPGGIDLHNNQYCEILNNYFSNCQIYLDETSYTLIRGNHITSTSAWGHDWCAIDLHGAYNVAENNEIGPSKDTDAFRVFGHDNIMRNNYIHDLTLSPNSGAHMDVFQTWGLNNMVSYNQVFENNLITSGDRSQTNLQMCMTENNENPNIHDFTVRNNIFVNVPGAANLGVPHIRFYNNTVYNCGTWSIIGASNANRAKGQPDYLEIFNNIFVSDYDHYGSFISGGGTECLFDYNFIAKPDGSPVEGFTEDHGVNGGEPRFTNPSSNDFHLMPGSPAIEKGTALTGLYYDMDGNLRPQGANWDIGAYETVFPVWESKSDFSQVQGIGTGNTGAVTLEFDVVPQQSMSAYGGEIGYAAESSTISNGSSFAMAVG